MSVFKPEINRLLSDELKFELTIKGIETGTVLQMRKALRSVVNLEKSGIFTLPKTDRFNEVLQYLVNLYSILESTHAGFDGDTTTSIFHRLSALICQGLRLIPFLDT